MTKQAIETFRCRIERVIDIHRQCEDLSCAEVIGVLEVIKLDLWNEMDADD